jgi:PAS domain S-box-containing protein
MVTMGQDGRHIDVNDAFCRSVGFSREELLAMSVHDIDTNHPAEIWPEFWEKLKQSGSLTFESRHRTKEGKVFPVEITASFFEYDGEEYHCVFARDITERKRVEEALMESEVRYRTLVSHIPQKIFYKDCNSVYISCNDLYAQDLGMPATDIIGKTDFEFYPSELAKKYRADDRSIMEQDRTVEIEENYIEHGELRTVFTVKTPVRNEQGEVVGLVGIFSDITERKLAEEKIKESEARYRALFETASEGILIADIQTKKFKYTNPSICNMLGYSHEELLRMGVNDIHPKEELEHVISEFMAQARGEKTLAPNLPCLRKDGKILYANISSTKALIDGKDCNIGFFTDVTEQKRADTALRESEEIFRQFMEHSPIYVFFKDQNIRATRLSRNFETMLGRPIGELLGKNMDDLFPSDLAKSMTADDMRILKEGKQVECEEELNGRYYSTIKFPIDLEGKPRYLAGFTIDITERRQAEEKIKEYSKNLESMVEDRTREVNLALADTERARDRIDGILKSTGEGLIVTDMYNRIVLMNRAAEELLEVRLSEVINRPVEYALDEETLLEHLKTTFSRDTDDKFYLELCQTGSKKPRYMQARSSVIHDKLGKNTGVVTSFHDITLEREVDQMKTEFLSTAAHELRTPLTSIQGFSEILLTRTNIKPDEQKKFLNYINKQAVKLAKIISELLDISRIESGRGFELVKESHNINDLVSQVVSVFRDQTEKHSFEVVIPDTPVEISFLILSFESSTFGSKTIAVL